MVVVTFIFAFALAFAAAFFALQNPTLVAANFLGLPLKAHSPFLYCLASV